MSAELIGGGSGARAVTISSRNLPNWTGTLLISSIPHRIQLVLQQRRLRAATGRRSEPSCSQNLRTPGGEPSNGSETEDSVSAGYCASSYSIRRSSDLMISLSIHFCFFEHPPPTNRATCQL